MNKRLLLIISIGILLLAGLLGMALVRQAAPIASPDTTQEPSPTETPHTADEPHDHADLGMEDLVAFERETAENPLLGRLPHDTPYWSLEFGGTSGSAYVVKATLYGDDSRSRDQMIAAQRPHIEAFIANTGQRVGSYSIEYHTVTVYE